MKFQLFQILKLSKQKRKEKKKREQETTRSSYPQTHTDRAG